MRVRKASKDDWQQIQKICRDFFIIYHLSEELSPKVYHLIVLTATDYRLRFGNDNEKKIIRRMGKLFLKILTNPWK